MNAIMPKTALIVWGVIAFDTIVRIYGLLHPVSSGDDYMLTSKLTFRHMDENEMNEHKNSSNGVDIREKILTVLDWWRHKHHYAFTGWDSVSSRMTYDELSSLDLSVATYEDITKILYTQSEIENWRVYVNNVKQNKVCEVDFYTLCNTIPRMFH